MIEPFPLLHQPPDSNSCLPTVVRAVLLWYGEAVSQEMVSVWCGETDKGCWLDSALEGLRLEGYEVEELIEDAENRIHAIVTDAEEPQPVIVTLKSPRLISSVDHAVVIVGMDFASATESVEMVHYFDPLTGSMEAMSADLFWSLWDFAGQRAIVLRP